ncbi:sulfur carrier protein ThiS [Engelhardtia mirabilis]|uniref:Sulfur carrier protein ThiS n=1 Tax=Engelhardtia mirabilis TaxID=2528011 RepID=A0A518BMP5_9BACT|nr:Sulfur carrier protein ThiS [Planctomycetes bacterium Pla133]QDV02571.1 Sulfur carrier protein ThiS [Planctomycetes bacterium Pla86]
MSDPESVHITVNGEPWELALGSTVAELLERLGLRPEVVAVEINRELAPRSTRAERILAEGDVVELVTLVGGG